MLLGTERWRADHGQVFYVTDVIRIVPRRRVIKVIGLDNVTIRQSQRISTQITLPKSAMPSETEREYRSAAGLCVSSSGKRKKSSSSAVCAASASLRAVDLEVVVEGTVGAGGGSSVRSRTSLRRQSGTEREREIEKYFIGKDYGERETGTAKGFALAVCSGGFGGVVFAAAAGGEGSAGGRGGAAIGGEGAAAAFLRLRLGRGGVFCVNAEGDGMGAGLREGQRYMQSE